MKPLKVFIYVQHLSGVGHTMRVIQIANKLAQFHKVFMTDGGRPVPIPANIKPIALPRLGRQDGKLTPLNSCQPVADILTSRNEKLKEAITTICPDVVLVEHYPFSKWELEEEILSLLTHARRTNPGIKVLASIRDICVRTDRESTPHFERRVIEVLHNEFNALLVHADPKLCRLTDYFSAGERIRIPVFHTGIVAAPPDYLSQQQIKAVVGHQPYVVVSTGGGPDRTALRSRVLKAWQILAQAGTTVNTYHLLIFGGVDEENRELRKLIDKHPNATWMGFNQAFMGWLGSAALSISCAGYNTCANLLASGTPALLQADPAMSDQPERQRIMTTHGMAKSLPGPDSEIEKFADCVLENLDRPRMRHSANLNGASRSAQLITEIASGIKN